MMTDRALLEDGLSKILPAVDPQAVDKLLRFSALLLEKNKVMNLTAVTEPFDVITRHFLDCAVLVPQIKDGQHVLDVGSGAGFPGLPLAILTNAAFTLLDAQRKRVDFLNEVIVALDLQNVIAVHGRAEEFANAHRETFDVATSRAVADLNVLCELAMPQLRLGGVFLAMKAADCGEEVARARSAVTTLGGAPAEVLHYTVPQSEVRRAIVMITKQAASPALYPRRFAKISAQPL